MGHDISDLSKSTTNTDKKSDTKPGGTQFSTIEEEIIDVIGREEIDRIINASLVSASPIVFDLRSLVNNPALLKYGIDYFSLEEEKIGILDSIVKKRADLILFNNPEVYQYITPIIYVNGYRIDKLNSDVAGKVVSIIGVPKDIVEKKVASEILYICDGCGIELRVKSDNGAPKCMRNNCPNKGSKMRVKAVVSEYDEVSFMLKTAWGQIRCVTNKRRVCDVNHDSWILLPNIENEVTGILRRDLKKGNQVEYWFEVLGARVAIHHTETATLKSLDEVRDCFPQIVGEDDTILLIILSLASRFNINRSHWIMGVVIQGQSSGGKSYLMNSILTPWKALGRVKELSRFTGAYLERMTKTLQKTNIDNLIIAVPELFSQTPQQLHIMLSEGKLVLGIVDKDTGEPVEYEIEGQPFLIATTTAIEFREDLENRVIIVKIDESAEQTMRVLKYWSSMALSNNRGMNDSAVGVIRMVNHLKSLKNCGVVVPYADKLLKLFDGVELHVTMRRDFQKMINIIMASALFFQNDRPRFKVTGNGEDEEEYTLVVATAEDYKNLTKLFNQMNITLSRLTPTEETILQIIRAENEDAGREPTRSEITQLLRAAKLYYSTRHVTRMIDKLENMGYIIANEERKPYRYRVIKTPKRVTLEELLPEVEEAVNQYINKFVR